MLIAETTVKAQKKKVGEDTEYPVLHGVEDAEEEEEETEING